VKVYNGGFSQRYAATAHDFEYAKICPKACLDGTAETTVGEGTLDVHAPHHPIGGWKDFFVHLVTITVGLLIAVGIEGCVERHREHKLVQEARETMREEIRVNSESMTSTLVSVKKQRATMEKNIETLTRIQ
jgi:hypothetical protein